MGSGGRRPAVAGGTGQRVGGAGGVCCCRQGGQRAESAAPRCRRGRARGSYRRGHSCPRYFDVGAHPECIGLRVTAGRA